MNTINELNEYKTDQPCDTETITIFVLKGFTPSPSSLLDTCRKLWNEFPAEILLDQGLCI